MSFGSTPNSCCSTPRDPQRRGLLIFRHADALALEVGGLVDLASLRTSMRVWKNLRVVKTGMPTKRSSPFDFAIISDEIDISDTSNSAKRNCRQNSSEGCSTRRQEIDALGLHPAVDDRPGARIGRDAEAELEGHDLVFI